jgi:Cu+-exporting ATPase
MDYERHTVTELAGPAGGKSLIEKVQYNPEKHLGPYSVTPNGNEAAEYTCPMHPQIVRDQPGLCPICGMALEPRAATSENENSELHDMTRRFWTSAALTVPILAFMILDLIPGDPLKPAAGQSRTILNARS